MPEHYSSSGEFRRDLLGGGRSVPVPPVEAPLFLLPPLFLLLISLLLVTPLSSSFPVAFYLLFALSFLFCIGSADGTN